MPYLPVLRGVGILALAQPAEARIVYTPAHVRIGPGGDVGSYALRFNGQMAFSISFFSDAASSNNFWSQVTIASAASNFTSNQIVGYPRKNGFGWIDRLLEAKHQQVPKLPSGESA